MYLSTHIYIQNEGDDVSVCVSGGYYWNSIMTRHDYDDERDETTCRTQLEIAKSNLQQLNQYSPLLPIIIAHICHTHVRIHTYTHIYIQNEGDDVSVCVSVFLMWILLEFDNDSSSLR
jgi:hypothetical protein